MPLNSGATRMVFRLLRRDSVLHGYLRIQLRCSMNGSDSMGCKITSLSSRSELDFDYLLDPANLNAIAGNIENRKRVGNINGLHETWGKIEEILVKKSRRLSRDDSTLSSKQVEQLWNDFYENAALIPNRTHPNVPIGNETSARIVEVVGEQKTRASEANKSSVLAETAAKKHRLLKKDMGTSCGDKSYALLDGLARLEHALVRFGMQHLISRHGFTPITVPDIIPVEIPECCGVMQRSESGILYEFTDPSGPQPGPSSAQQRLCLAGTAEMGIASCLYMKLLSEEELPLKLVACSRCYRPEVGSGTKESGLYRIHEFTKMEMFVVTCNDDNDSESWLDKLVSIQKEIYSSLELCFRLCEMPSEELGASAYHKYDIEAWMPGRNLFGEISSASNCTDFQSRRLGLKYQDKDGVLRFPHTLNATACAVPRTIIALIEQKVIPRTNKVPIPKALQPYFGDSILGASREPLKMIYQKPYTQFRI